MTTFDSKTCPDCAERVKAAAIVCKHCGRRFEVSDLKQSDTIVIESGHLGTSQLIFTVLGIIALLSIAAAFIIATQSKEQDVPSNLENRAKAYIVQQFHDPETAKFANIVTTPTCVSGDVNGKNLMGGYVGFKAFFYNELTGVGQISPDDPELQNYPQRGEGGGITVDKLEFLKDYNLWANRKADCIAGKAPSP